MFQRCLHGKKQIVLTVKKRCFHNNFKMQKKKRCLHGVSAVAKRCFNFTVKKKLF